MASEEKLSVKVSTAASEVASDLGSFIRDLRENAQVSVRQLAERSGVSNPYLSQVERGLRKPSADVLSQIAKALRISAEVLYVRAGILEPSEHSQVRDAIITDTIERWDAEEASRRIELHVGRDLQFIRINGTVVGALAGLVIYAVAQLLF